MTKWEFLNNKEGAFMGSKKGAAVISSGNIDTNIIYDTHCQIKELVESYKEINLKVTRITEDIKDNWVGKGRNEFQSQYKTLIGKIEDFGDTLQDIYDGLVEAEAAYEDADDEIRQKYVMSMK